MDDWIRRVDADREGTHGAKTSPSWAELTVPIVCQCDLRIVMMPDCALSHGKGSRAAFRERGFRGCVLDSILWRCANFPFNSLWNATRSKISGSNRTNKSENFPRGCPHIGHIHLKSRILYFVYSLVSYFRNMICLHTVWKLRALARLVVIR